MSAPLTLVALQPVVQRRLRHPQQPGSLRLREDLTLQDAHHSASLPRVDFPWVLRDLAERDGDSGPFQQRLAELRAVHARRPSLLERLNLAGLDT
ncbi:hypothetical protein Van01_44000 [Micromonospora andamanensis]|uniref:Uncharacterized protein n=1 Tax=Micromonospora andamanensis TaxID=1287068 RepID=A0ABQ4I009_9ACTN|nr:hypothetical protein Van01_44000 [Micromonospora andamanensis]